MYKFLRVSAVDVACENCECVIFKRLFIVCRPRGDAREVGVVEEKKKMLGGGVL